MENTKEIDRLIRERDDAQEWIGEIFSLLGLPDGDMGALENFLLERKNTSEAFTIAYNERVKMELERNEARRLACLYRDQFYAVSMPTVKPPKFSWEEGYGK